MQAGSGADRHENFETGTVDTEAILSMVKTAGAPAVICETPWPGIEDDVAYLKSNL